MFEYVIKFTDNSGVVLEGYEINIPKSYKQGYVECVGAGRTVYYSTHFIATITEKRVDRDV